MNSLAVERLIYKSDIAAACNFDGIKSPVCPLNVHKVMDEIQAVGQK